MDLTPEQAAIVHAEDIDLAVSAGAGTGKTHVLVERYVALLERCAIPEIVAITFTEAAAAEMRQRVRREVLTRDALKEHQPHVDEALIGTIHSLCLRLLRERPVEAALDPAVQVLSEDQAELLRREACAAAVDAAAEADDARTAALGTLGVYQAGLMLPSMVASRDEVRASFAVLPAVAEDMAAHLRALVDAACEEALGPLRDSIPPVLDDLRPSVLDPSDKLAQCLEAAAEALDSGAEGDLDEWARSVAEAIRCINLTGGKKASWAIDVPEVRAHLKAARTAMEAALALAAPWNDADAGCSAALPGLRALFEDACGRYEAAKREQHGLDFLDLEIAAVDLLETHPEVAAAYRRAWRHLMVDEAQDVSGIQARLIRALLGTVGADGATEGERPRLFLVGDEKQSIYRFRGADVRQFRDLRVAVSAAGGQVLPLSASFRTHTDLVERMNGLFESAFDGREVLMERMSGRPGVSPVGPHVVVTGIDASERNGHAQRLTEADLVAAEVAGLIDEGRLVWDKRAREYRPVRWGDIAILLRRYTNVHVFEHALEAHHVPFATPSGTGFFTRQEVLDLGNLLRWLHEPDDEIALFGVLRSPLFILRDDTLYALRAGRRPLLLAAADPPEGIAADERARCLFAAETLRALRRSARTAPAADLLDEALAATGFEASWAPLSGGDQVLANVRKLVRLCHDLAGYTLGEVVDYLERRRDDLVAREGPAVLDRADAVQIMTVHGAKGLEFPVVFAPEAHTAPYIGNDADRWRAGEGVSFTLERGEDDEQRPRPAFFS
ncbi:MAG: UvrD-helicase domain-containing protein, partial [Dehalococcoidia bacterium]